MTVITKDREVAERENLSFHTVNADMTKPFPFPDESFDIIFCPVSNVYIEELDNLYNGCFRVLKDNGLLMIGFMNPWISSFNLDDAWDQPEKELIPQYELPYNARKLEEGRNKIDLEYRYEYSYTWKEQIGTQMRAGFFMVDFYESKDENNRLTKYENDYLANLSIKSKALEKIGKKPNTE